MMNDRLCQIGLQNTHFVNPHGLDAPDHYSTPRDIALLARVVMKYPLFAEIVRTKEIDLPTDPPHHLVTTNKLLGAMPEAIGIKTGTTDNAGPSLVSAVERDGRRVYVTVMNTPDVVADSRAIYEYVFSRYTWASPMPSDSQLWGRLAIEIQKTLRDSKGRLIVPAWQAPFVRGEAELSDDTGQARLVGVGIYIADELVEWRWVGLNDETAG